MSSVLNFLDHCRVQIRNLYAPYDPYGIDPLPQTSICTFPTLELYSGGFELIPAFHPVSSVQSIISYVCATDDVENILAVLRMTTVPLEEISFTSQTWNLRFFSQYAPGTLYVEFQCDDEDVDAIEVS